MKNKNIDEVICKFRSYPNARLRIRQFYFISVIEIGLSWYEHPLFHSPTPKVHKDTQTSLWSIGNEIHHSGIWIRDQRTWREGRSTHWISIWVLTGDVVTRSWLKEWSEGERMESERFTTRSSLTLFPQGWRIRCSVGL